MPCIHGKDRNLKVSLKIKIEVWKEFEEKFLNKKIKRSGEINVEKKKEDLVQKYLSKQLRKQ